MSKYLMDQGGHDEAARMARNHTAVEIFRWLQEAGIKEGMRTLSVGPCNPTELYVIHEFTHQPVVGLELSLDRVRQGNESVVSKWNEERKKGLCPIVFVPGNVQDVLPFQGETFDAVVSFRVFEYLSDPITALTNMFRCLRPGGLCVVGDIDGYGSNHEGMPPDLEWTLALIFQTLEERGQFHPRIGRRLYRLFHECKFTDLCVAAEPYHLVAGTISPHEEQNWMQKFEAIRPVGEEILGTRTAYDEFVEDMIRFLRDERTFGYSMFFLVTGHRPTE